ncbi:putative lipase/esterase family protein [Thozetella sp. PMI_491]|nr:putative lipase/esterase family protein [Thozetella sp. PMI_491]
MVLNTLRTLRTWFTFSIDAFLAPNLPFSIRWRMLAAQPIICLSYSIAAYRWIFRRPFKAEYLPVAPGRSIRVLIFDRAPGGPSQSSTRKLRPIHLNCHSGGYIGGIPEASVPFCDRIAKETGAVVFATSYRCAPRYTFPAAIDDVDAVLAYLRANADKYGADPNLITVSGLSAGGGLALATSLSVPPGIVKASVTFYGAIDLRLKPEEKPKPANFPTKDPMRFMLPLYDTYAGPVRPKERDNPRMSPVIAPLERLPEHMLLIVAGIDILVHEQTSLVERLNEEKKKDPKHAARRIERLYIEKAFHGWLELPPVAVTKTWTDLAYESGIKFIQDAHAESGWEWKPASAP